MPKNKTVFRQSVKKHLMDFEFHIELPLFHTNAGIDVACSARIAQNLRKRSCAENYKKKIVYSATPKDVARTQSELPPTSYLARAPKRTCGRIEYKSAFMLAFTLPSTLSLHVARGWWWGR